MKLKIETIAIDFDGTLVADNYPGIGTLMEEAKEFLVDFRGAGGKVILWTCRTGEELQEAVNFLYKNNVLIDCINDNLPENMAAFRREFPSVPEKDVNCRKIWAEMYIDDKNPGGVNWVEIRKLVFESP